MTFGAVVREAREQAELTLHQLSAVCGLSPSTICKIERGRDPTFESALRLSKCLHFSLDEFSEYLMLPGEL